MSCQRCGRELIGPECLCVQNAVLRDERDQALLERNEARSDRNRFESERFHWKTTAEKAIRERNKALALLGAWLDGENPFVETMKFLGRRTLTEEER